MVYLVNCLTLISFTLTFRFADFIAYLGESQKQAGLIVSFGVCIGILMKLSLATLGHRLVLKSCWMIFASLMAIGHLLFVVSEHSIIAAYLGRSLIILGYAGSLSCAYVVVSNLAPRRAETQTLALFGSSTFLAMIVGTLFLDYARIQYNDDSAFFRVVWITGIAVSLLGVLVLGVLKSPQSRIGASQKGGIKESFYAVFRGKYLWPSTCLGVAFLIPQLFVARLAVERGFSSMGSFFITYALSSFLFRIALSRMDQRFNRETLVFLGGIAFFAAQICFLQVYSSWQLILPALLTGLGRAVMEPSLITLSKDSVPIKFKAVGTVVSLVAIDFGLFIGAPVLGWALDFSGIDFVFMVISAFMFANLVWVGFLAYQKRSQVQLAHAMRTQDKMRDTLDDSIVAKVLVTDEIHPLAIHYFQKRKDIHFVYEPKISRSELLASVSDVDVLIVRINTLVDKTLFNAATKLRLVGTATAGMSHIDLEEARERNVLVFNCPGKNANATAELTIAGMLQLVRKMRTANDQLINSSLNRSILHGRELTSLSIGVWGFGQVGQRVAQKASGLGMKVFVHSDNLPQSIPEEYIVCPSLEQLAERVDVLSCHVPLTTQTADRINKTLLQRLKPQSFLLNLARGEVVIEDDLLDALDTGILAGAFLDVQVNEQNPYRAILEHPKIYCTPHIGGLTLEAMEEIARAIIAQSEDLIDRRNVERSAHKLLTAIDFEFERTENNIQLAQIFDVSDKGIGILSKEPMNAGEIVRLKLGGSYLGFRVAWSSQEDLARFKIGLHRQQHLSVQDIENQLLAAVPGLNERNEDRANPFTHAEVKLDMMDGRVLRGTLVNESSNGFGISTYHPLEKGTVLQLVTEHAGIQRVMVMWCSQTNLYSYQIGLKTLETAFEFEKSSA